MEDNIYWYHDKYLMPKDNPYVSLYISDMDLNDPREDEGVWSIEVDLDGTYFWLEPFSSYDECKQAAIDFISKLPSNIYEVCDQKSKLEKEIYNLVKEENERRKSEQV
jgi:hypothetical protein